MLAIGLGGFVTAGVMHSPEAGLAAISLIVIAAGVALGLKR